MAYWKGQAMRVLQVALPAINEDWKDMPNAWSGRDHERQWQERRPSRFSSKAPLPRGVQQPLARSPLTKRLYCSFPEPVRQLRSFSGPLEEASLWGLTREQGRGYHRGKGGAIAPPQSVLPPHQTFGKLKFPMGNDKCFSDSVETLQNLSNIL